MKRVLLTGASGFIGTHCVPALLNRHFEVHAVSRTPKKKGDLEAVHWHETDLLNSEQISKLMRDVKPEYLLHLAWCTTPGKCWTSLENLRWLQASIDLVQAFGCTGGRRMIVAGSCAEYEWGRDEPCREELTPLKPATLYGACKHALHTVLEAYAALRNLSTAWGRIFFLYGSHEHPSRLVASVICSLLRNEPAFCSHGEQVRDFLFVADAAEALVTILESEMSGAVNIGSGRPVRLVDVINEIGEQLDRRDLIQLNALSASPDEPRALVANIERLTEELGWQPKHDLQDGIEKSVEWWRQNLDAVTPARGSI